METIALVETREASIAAELGSYKTQLESLMARVGAQTEELAEAHVELVWTKIGVYAAQNGHTSTLKLFRVFDKVKHIPFNS